jgi:hypothetical protein
MRHPTVSGSSRAQYCLHYAALRDSAHAFDFPCDEEGRVDIESLSEEGRNDYLFARAVVGGELAMPIVASSRTGRSGTHEAAARIRER